MSTPESTRPARDTRAWEERKHPLMWADYEAIPVDSLTLDNAMVSLEAPYAVPLRFFSTGHPLGTWLMVEDSLNGRHIREGDVLIYDRERTAPEDDAIQLVAERTDEAEPWIVARVCRLTEGEAEYHATVPGYPILGGERKIYGTLAAVVRCTDGTEDGRMSVPPEDADCPLWGTPTTVAHRAVVRTFGQPPLSLCHLRA